MSVAGTPAISDREFALFRDLIYRAAGIHLSEAKKMLLVGRLHRRLQHYGLASYGAYHDLVTGPAAGGELQTMVDLLTTNETYFFREERHFEFLRRQVLPQRDPGRPFEIWSAACSTGEEVYTLAMVLADELGIDGPWRVTGSDISTRVLATAAAGHYPIGRSRGLPADYLRRYCLKGVGRQEGTFLVDRRLHAQVRFQQVNLNAPLPDLGPFDAIFLRNVMIYFDTDTKRRVVARLVERLRPGGHFIVGHSESLNGISDTLRAVAPTVYRKP